MRAGQRQIDVAASLGDSGQTLGNWVKAQAAGKLSGGATVKPVSPEQMEISRLKAELSRVKMERDILKNQRGLTPPVGVETICAMLAMEGSGRSLFGGA